MKKMATESREMLDSFWLCNIRGIGAVSVRRLVQEAGSAERVKELPRRTLEGILGSKRADILEQAMGEKRRRTVFEKYYKYRSDGIFFIPLWHENYPARLKNVPDPPAALYGKGRPLPAGAKTVAVIGARDCSAYGSWAARRFAAGLAGAGVAIVSGMARGVDGIAGWAALEAGGVSAAVLGCGVDVCYPPENRPLYERLSKEGCLLSEYPPQTLPSAGLFPARNRIISGLSDLVLVTEARERSGTLITVDMALEQGREVFAVPGRITDTCSKGCNRLIADGAGIAVSPKQILQELGFEDTTEKNAQDSQSCSAASLSLRAHILRALDWDPRGLDEILQALRSRFREGPLPADRVMEELARLCMEGKIGCISGRYYLLDGEF